ncbi:MAG: 4Fe-4S dicluster domain-containing protein, partial [Hyphomicrobiaceae bacterium]
MQIDVGRLGEALGDDRDLPLHSHLCRRQVAAFEAALKDGAPVRVACTQEAPLFREIAEEHDFDDLSFVNIRERAGWCDNGSGALAKMAALIAEAGHEAKPAGLMTIKSDGQCLVYGSGQQVLDVAQQLSGRLSVTVILTDATDAVPPSTVEVPIHTGKIRSVSGVLGSFELTVDRFAPTVPSSKGELLFEVPRDGFSTTCDLILDLSQDAPLFSAAISRDGYFKVDPNYPAGVAKAMFEISDFVGEFEKPLYVDYDGDICAHSRSGKTGCRNCLDNCPSGAIAPNGDTVNISAGICAGCGTCSAVCPTGAVSYAYPGRQDLLARIQT